MWIQSKKKQQQKQPNSPKRGKRSRPSRDCLVLHMIGWESGPIPERSKVKPKQSRMTFETQFKSPLVWAKLFNSISKQWYIKIRNRILMTEFLDYVLNLQFTANLRRGISAKWKIKLLSHQRYCAQKNNSEYKQTKTTTKDGKWKRNKAKTEKNITRPKQNRINNKTNKHKNKQNKAKTKKSQSQLTYQSPACAVDECWERSVAPWYPGLGG